MLVADHEGRGQSDFVTVGGVKEIEGTSSSLRRHQLELVRTTAELEGNAPAVEPRELV